MPYSLLQAAKFHKCLSSDMRIRLLNLLYHGGMLSVSDCILITGGEQSLMTKHLLYMASSGIVDSYRESRFSFYYLSPAALAFVQKEITLLEDPLLKKDIKKLDAYKKVGELSAVVAKMPV